MLTFSDPQSPSFLALAWRHTVTFWQQTGLTVLHHPWIVLACAAIPAAERAWVLLRGAWVGRGKLALLELFVTLWRVLLCAVAVWAACSGRELHSLTSQVGAMDAWQLAIGKLGAYMAHHLRVLVWELLFFAAAFLLLLRAVSAAVRVLARTSSWLRDEQHQMALQSVLRNLVLAPLILIYIVEMCRPALR
jgi:hypothetical protein